MAGWLTDCNCTQLRLDANSTRTCWASGNGLMGFSVNASTSVNSKLCNLGSGRADDGDTGSDVVGNNNYFSNAPRVYEQVMLSHTNATNRTAVLEFLTAGNWIDANTIETSVTMSVFNVLTGASRR